MQNFANVTSTAPIFLKMKYEFSCLIQRIKMNTFQMDDRCTCGGGRNHHTPYCPGFRCDEKASNPYANYKCEWKWKKLDRDGIVSLGAPLNPSMVNLKEAKHWILWQIRSSSQEDALVLFMANPSLETCRTNQIVLRLMVHSTVSTIFNRNTNSWENSWDPLMCLH